jgi:hypothetical protein
MTLISPVPPEKGTGRAVCAALLPTAAEYPQDGIEHSIELLAHVLGEKAQDEVAVLLQELILAPVPAIRVRIREMLGAVELNDQPRIREEQRSRRCRTRVWIRRRRYGAIVATSRTNVARLATRASAEAVSARSRAAFLSEM